MTTPLAPIPLPDVEAMITTFLRTLIPNSVTVDARIPTPYDGSQTCVFVQRIGGQMDEFANQRVQDKATVDLHCIAPSKQAANDLMRTVRACVSVMDTYVHSLGVVSKVDEIVGPLWIADPTYAPAGKYILQTDFFVHNS